jgi:hypothetical protein
LVLLAQQLPAQVLLAARHLDQGPAI